MPGHRPGGGEGLFLSRAGPSKMRCTGTTKPARDQPGAPIRQERDARGRLLQADQGVKGAALRRSPAGPRQAAPPGEGPLRVQAAMQASGARHQPPTPGSTSKKPPPGTPHRLAASSAAPAPIIAFSSARGSGVGADHDGPQPPARLLASQPRQKPRLLITPRTTRRWPGFARQKNQQWKEG